METLTASELMQEAASETTREWCVRDLIPRGSVSLLAARKGAGKSVLSMVLADAVSRGEPFLGRPTERGQVLYVSTEDDEAELHGRYARLLGTSGDKPSVDLDLTNECPTVAEGAIEHLHDWCGAADAPKLIIIDLVVNVDPDLLVARRGFAAVAKSMKAWINLAREEHVAVVLVVHMWRGPETTKNNPNPIDKIQGSGGLTAYAQTILAIMGEPNTTDRALFFASKFGGGNMAVTIDGKTMTCTLRDVQANEDPTDRDIRAKLRSLVAQAPGRKAREYAHMLPDRHVDATVRMLQLMDKDGELKTNERRYYLPSSTTDEQQMSLADGMKPFLSIAN